MEENKVQIKNEAPLTTIEMWQKDKELVTSSNYILRI